ncbi:MAG: SufS family cysteine desulfurase [Hydrotalea flava]|uniref:cysteine desulfurase n=1 Tax=Hydrotalea TaxID=1004300 RepID=UPI0016A49FBE|nr:MULTISPECIES: cysteine desulfurase [Hydrotalea]NIM36210.1 SufS family cysteine desulfurase [Hydrotalea flava]NIM39061.1 SufS family cysteine desulfurase [Hydrotalea flava]NIN04296.1 SufS family cysteine desulfurase [Hydrotalea flava]NIN15922.1 SufS family cysteine desulfurase [Hydrotalea flava]NIO94987.1 SufS family cysteine desulfurase [Hydrotalea flava]
METSTHILNTLQVEDIRKQFPILKRTIHNKPIVYLDNAATTQKPMVVIDALSHYYMHSNANIHRGIHTLAEEATAAYEATRTAVQVFINASCTEEIIFTRGTTESINLVANTWGRKNIQEGDEIIISEMEHHSNIVPWQILCEEKKAVLKVIPISDEGELLLDVYRQLLTSKTKLVAITYVSNSLGTINPISEIIQMAHNAGALVLVDGAQATVHLDIDVQKMDCDFYAFSGHKIYAPTGVGVLYGKKALLEAMPVFMGGGEMIKEVSFAKTTYAELPYKYEAGTPNIADTIALKAAIDFMRETDVAMIHQHEKELLEYATKQMLQIPNLRIYGTAENKTGVISFLVNNIHPQDMGVLLDNQGIAVRTGHHCTQPLMHRLGIPGTVRASFAVYNTMEEVDRLINGIQKSIKMLL